MKCLGGAVVLVVLLLGTVPKDSPSLFAEGVVSTADDESGFALSPDGSVGLFGLIAPATTGGNPLRVICVVSRDEKGHWRSPQIAPFSGKYHDMGPAFAPDGSRLYFVSDRPVGDEEKHDLDIWYVERVGSGWSDARPLAAPVNSSANEYGVSVAANGTLYFSSNRSGGRGSYDLFRARLENGEYTSVESLGDVNTDGPEVQPAISPDERILVYSSSGRRDEIVGVHKTYAHGDLYASVQVNGSFSVGRQLGAPINSGGGESWPSFSADGKQFFFSSDRGFATYRVSRRMEWPALQRQLESTLNGLGNIWQIDISKGRGLWRWTQDAFDVRISRTLRNRASGANGF